MPGIEVLPLIIESIIDWYGVIYCPVQFFSYKMRQWRAKILCLCIGMSTLTLSV
jgi:hypothetical protein